MTECKLATLRISVVAICVVALASIGGSARVSAQSESEVWQSIGPNLPTDFDSATYDLEVDPHTPTTVYVGSRAGVYKTTDAGAHWFSVSVGLPGDGHPIIDSLVIDPQNPSTLYAGVSVRTLFEPDGLGVFKTTDGGNTWTSATQGLGGLYTFELAIDPQTPSTVYAIAGGDVLSCCTGLLYKTTDGGANWAVLNDFQTNFILVDPQTPSTLYASARFGVRKSTDGGATWSDASGPTPFPTALAADPFTSGIVYAASSGVYKTTNGGGSWTAINNGLTDLSVVSIAVNPISPGSVYVGTTHGAVFKTSDGGGSWSAASGGLGTTIVHDLAVDPQTPETLYASTEARGVYKTTNSGDTWAAANNGLSNAQVHSLAIAATQPARLYAGTFRGVTSTSVEGTSQWTTPMTLGFARALVVDPQNPSTLYGNRGSTSPGSSLGSVFKSTDGGATWTSPSQSSFIITGGLAIDPLTPSILFAGGQGPAGFGVYKTTDGTASWSLTGLHQGARALAVDPVTSTTVYAGTGDGVFKTTDGGATWTTSGELASLSVLALAIDPQTTSHVLASTQGGALYRSDDGGEHWGAAAGLPGVDVFAIAIDPQSPSIVYAGTYGAGVFRSTDGGWNFGALNDGLTQPYVRGLAIDPSTGVAYAGTDGSGVFAITPTVTAWPYYLLSIERPGHGSGTVETTDGFMYCGQHCSDFYSATTEVTLKYTEASDSFFVGWQGCDVVNEDGTCFVTMDRARTVIAEFALRN